MQQLLLGLPKAEMHIHLEGTIEPGTGLELAQMNKIADFPYHSMVEIQQRMGDAKDRPSFIKVYEQLLSVLRTEADFHEVAMRYFRHTRGQNVFCVEMFFDPQMHPTRGIPFATVMAGLNHARDDAAQFLGLRRGLILCFNRDRSAESAMEHLEMASSELARTIRSRPASPRKLPRSTRAPQRRASGSPPTASWTSRTPQKHP